MPLRCVVVTPERTQLDREAEYVSLPMFDGEVGVMQGRAPMIGRLGYGTMKLQTAAGPEKYYIDGGFAHIEGNVVNVLTGKAIPADLLDSEESRQSLEQALDLPAKSPEAAQLKATAVMRARGQVRASR